MEPNRRATNRERKIPNKRNLRFEEKEIIRFNASTLDVPVTVIVPTWDSMEHLPACLNSIENQAVVKIEVIVSDSNSKDGVEAYVKEHHPQARFIQSKTGMGISSAINRGLEHATDPAYVAVVYPGSQVRYDGMVRLIRALKEDDRAGIATPRVMEADHPQIFRKMGMAFTSSFEPFPIGALRYANYDCYKRCFVPAASGSCMIIDHEIFKKIGRFDQNYMLCWEDIEFSFRATVNGYRCIYEPDAVVYENNTSIMDPWSPMNVYHSCRGVLPTAMKFLPDETLFSQCNDLVLRHLKYAFIYYGAGGRLLTALKGKWAGFKLAYRNYRMRKAGTLDAVEEHDIIEDDTPVDPDEKARRKEKLRIKKEARVRKQLIRGDRLWKVTRD